MQDCSVEGSTTRLELLFFDDRDKILYLAKPLEIWNNVLILCIKIFKFENLLRNFQKFSNFLGNFHFCARWVGKIRIIMYIMARLGVRSEARKFLMKEN